MKRGAATVINRYARSFFQVAEEQKTLPAARADLQNLTQIWKENPDMAILLSNTSLSKAKIESIVMDIAKKAKVSELTIKFLKLLLDKGRLDILPLLAQSFEKLWRIYQGEVEVAVTTAIQIGDNLKQEIQTELTKQSGKKPLISWKTDPKILGGLIVEWPDKVHDSSLARKLSGLRNVMVESV